jgi:hypothetical protein
LDVPDVYVSPHQPVRACELQGGPSMNNDRISRYRSEVIEKAINVEWLMSAIISQHYFKRVVMPFLLEVLYDEYFSFALKRRILEKIIENLDRKMLQDLNRANTIRNYFAHCNQRLFHGVAFPQKEAEGEVIDPRKLDRTIDFEKLYDEFTGIIGELEKYLANVYLEKGGELYTHRGEDFVKVERGEEL